MRCANCDDVIVIEKEGCDKCNNTHCGYCCELDNTPLCGDHLVPIGECGCKL